MHVSTPYLAPHRTPGHPGGARRDTIEAIIWTLATSFLSLRHFVSMRPSMGGCGTLSGAPRPPGLYLALYRRKNRRMLRALRVSTFWCLRWMEQSRSYRWMTLPNLSPVEGRRRKRQIRGVGNKSTEERLRQTRLTAFDFPFPLRPSLTCRTFSYISQGVTSRLKVATQSVFVRLRPSRLSDPSTPPPHPVLSRGQEARRADGRSFVNSPCLLAQAAFPAVPSLTRIPPSSLAPSLARHRPQTRKHTRWEKMGRKAKKGGIK